METIFAAIALPCLAFALCDYLAWWKQNWKQASKKDDWKREDDNEN